ncbi:MAG: 50S ribosomal protein L3 [Candidatus Omnitrophica bacterium]|jgi:large subunit ribosomal protein L3|nr:50S ribosomal protein L3 [Candidatus Omnitrophota bacterium]MDD5660435.1 50S ribosomal protein L3 [Candidatus Omnitrophota bacterium]
MIGLIGKKIGMTQIFAEDNSQVAVTAIQAGPCPILMVNGKNIQLGFDLVKEKSVKKPQLGFFKKINITPRNVIKDVSKEAGVEYKVGEELKVDLFSEGDFVDISGISIGKGFAGGMKRWHWKGGPRTHGSTSHRRVGSIGSSTTPGRVFRGHHMPGHLGAQKATIQNLKVIRVDLANNLLLVEGGVPGHKNGYLVITKALKKRPKKAAVKK